MVYPAELDLDIAGVLEGTDKSSSVSYGWGYLDTYEHLFAHLRDQAFNFVEIGAASGGSLRLWRDTFPKATIVGVDINEECRAHVSERIVVEIGSQADAEFVGRIGATYRPTVVIDDGSHQAEHIVFTFEHMFEFLSDGGIYTVEDTAFHFGRGSGGWNKSQATPIDRYFPAIARSLMAREQSLKDASPKLEQIYRDIESVTFAGGVIIIRKRAAKRAPGPMIAAADRYLAGQPQGAAAKHVRLAGYAIRRGKNDALAMGQVDRALALDPQSAGAYSMKATVLERQGKLTEALAASGRALELDTGRMMFWIQNGRLRIQAQDFSGAVASLENAIKLRPTNAAARKLLAEARKALGQPAKS